MSGAAAGRMPRRLPQRTCLEFHRYIIASDLDRKEFAGKEIELQFVGKIGEKTVVTKNYVVSANCCHTYLVKGDKEVVVKNKELQ